jgi:hypothetical protein
LFSYGLILNMEIFVNSTYDLFFFKTGDWSRMLDISVTAPWIIIGCCTGVFILTWRFYGKLKEQAVPVLMPQVAELA